MRLQPSKTKTVFLLTISLVFTIAGVGAIGRGREFAGWFVALFFGVCSTGFAIHLLPGASYLDLSPEGFVVSSLFRRWALTRWDSVSEFHVAPVPGRESERLSSVANHRTTRASRPSTAGWSAQRISCRTLMAEPPSNWRS